MTRTTVSLAGLLETHDDGDFLRAVAEAVLQLIMETDRSVRISVYRPAGLFPSDRAQPRIGEKRSLNMRANWLTAVSHPRPVRAVFSCPRIAG